MSAEELLAAAIRAGGTVRLREDGKAVAVNCPADLIPQLRAHREEIISLLRSRASVFPHCPRCGSYYLYRRNNAGPYECESCGLLGIDEARARRVH